ncbi:MAG: hypothetical protein DRP42_05060, partial [Tenericutes bacterium]
SAHDTPQGNRMMARRKGTSGAIRMHFRDADGGPWCRRSLADHAHTTTEDMSKVTCKACLAAWA